MELCVSDLNQSFLLGEASPWLIFSHEDEEPLTLPDVTVCFKAVAEHKAGRIKAAGIGREAMFGRSLTSVNSRAAAETRDSCSPGFCQNTPLLMSWKLA